MTEADFHALEFLLGCPLPASYRRIMARYPLNPNDVNSAIALPDDPQSIIRINRGLREGEFAEEWRPEWFAIGNGPSGDIYILDLSAETDAVLAWDHETHDLAHEAQDLESFVERRKREELESRSD
jgi:hypothetical protein